MPPKISAGVIDYVDLDIDLLVWPDGSVIILDMDEFETNSEIYTYPDRVRRLAIETLEMIRRKEIAVLFENSWPDI